jgi:hypothetical protein
MLENCADLVADAYTKDAAYTGDSNGENNHASLFDRRQRYALTQPARQTLASIEAAFAVSIRMQKHIKLMA